MKTKSSDADSNKNKTLLARRVLLFLFTFFLLREALHVALHGVVHYAAVALAFVLA